MWGLGKIRAKANRANLKLVRVATMSTATFVMKCDLCGRSFYGTPSGHHSAEAMARWKITNHWRESHTEASFVCDLCSTKCSNKNNISDHLAVIHFGKQRKVKSNCFKCDSCPQQQNNAIVLWST